MVFMFCLIFLEKVSSHRLITNQLPLLYLLSVLCREQLKFEYRFTLIMFANIFFANNVLKIVLALDEKMFVRGLTLSDVVGQTLARHNMSRVIGASDRHL